MLTKKQMDKQHKEKMAKKHKDEIALMHLRKGVAQNVLMFFKNIVEVLSPNRCDFFCDIDEEDRQLLRDHKSYDGIRSIERGMTFATDNGIGNCLEKASICYCSLYSNPMLKENSCLSLAKYPYGDHNFVIISDFELILGHEFYIRNLPRTTMIVDGWTEDWYFPNLDSFTMYTNNLGSFPNPIQYAVRLGMHRQLITKICKPLTE